MSDIEQLRQAAKARREESLMMSAAYSNTLFWLMPANIILVVGAALLSLIAGASVLRVIGILSPNQAGVLALISAAFTIIHSTLGCEHYQAECKKLLSFHRGMALDYANLETIDDPEEFRSRLTALNDQISSCLRTATAQPLFKKF